MAESTVLTLKQKLADASSASEILPLLGELKAIPMTLGLLQRTLIGKTVTSLKKHADDEVSSTARQLVKAWKKRKRVEEEEDETPSTPTKKATTRMPGTPTSPSGADVDATFVVGSEALPASGACGDSIRDKVRTVFYNIFVAGVTQCAALDSQPDDDETAARFTALVTARRESDGAAAAVLAKHEVETFKDVRFNGAAKKELDELKSAWAEKKRTLNRTELVFHMAKFAEPADVAASVEDAMYAHFGNTGKDYRARFRVLSSNLKDKSNPVLRADVLSGYTTAETLCTMTHEQLASEELKLERKRVREFLFAASRSDVQHAAAVTDEFKCGKCGARSTTYFQMQTRSADEPMTVFITCTKCGNKWRQ